MNFPGKGGVGGMNAEDPNIKKMSNLMESCYAKTVMSGVAGFGLGGVFGLFMASMSYDTPYHTPTPTQSPPGAPAATAAATGAKTATTTAATGTAAATSTATTAATTAAGTAAKTAIGAGVAAPTTVTTAATTAATASTVAATTASTAAPAAATASTSPAALFKPTTLLTPAPKPVIASISNGAAAAASSVASFAEPVPLPLRQQLAIGFRDMGSRSWSSAKNFGTVGALFAGIECGIEGLRAKNDMGNGVAAGCLTGAILARNAGPQAAAIGCAGFAAFSAAIDAYLRMPPSDD